ncbi:hypothetical protein RAS1_36550 [Phycisphaerae bacterium RAS1]|nr:hypothetical protein RAS1_36550 [Phycisphaerae bacterium RAS1]
MLTRSEFAAKSTRQIVLNVVRTSAETPDDLREYLNSLPLDVLRKVVAVMYLGRGGSGRTFAGILAQPLPCYSTKVAAICKLIEKQPRLCDYLSKGLDAFDRASLDR